MKKVSLLLFLYALHAGAAEHVVLVVWDGLRPDSINQTDAPILTQLAHEGVFFSHHHAAYVSSTEVNGVTLATGTYSARHGVLANREYRPDIDLLKPVAMESSAAIRSGDRLTNGRYLEMPTVPEILRSAGHSVAVAGTKPVARLFDRSQPLIFAGHGSFNAPNTRLDNRTTDRLIGPMWANGVPQLSVLWLSEPDLSQHEDGPGSPRARAAIRGSDLALGRVIEELRTRGIRDKTDVFVVSDHGFSTVSYSIDLARELRKAGFPASREFKRPAKDGSILVVGLGGSVMVYVTGPGEATIRKLVEYLQRQDYTGVIFTRTGMAGTFAFDQAHLNTEHLPDILVALHWSDHLSGWRKPGMLVSDIGRRSGQGTHASLSRYDIHNTLIAAGPDFKGGTTNGFPSSNADIAPTILEVLGVPVPQPMDGRVLTSTPALCQSRKLEAGIGDWRQYLDITECDGAFYLEEGNGYSQVVHTQSKRVTP